jgi:protein-L-isoaspartate O-methyltransferase
MKIDYDRMAGLYARFRRVHPVVLEHLLADLNASSRVLEIGAGSGNYISTISKMIGCECHGIDLRRGPRSRNRSDVRRPAARPH